MSFSGARCAASDAHGGIVRAVRELFPGAAWQRCVVHPERDVIDACPTRAMQAAAGKVLHAALDEEDPAWVRAPYRAACGVVSKLSADADRVMDGAEADALAYLEFPEAHRRRIRTNNMQDHANREIKRRTDAVQVFPSSRSLVRLVGAALADQNDEWAAGHFMDASGMRDLGRDAESPAPTEETLRRAEVIVLEAMRAAA